MSDVLAQTRRELAAASNILVVTHIRPDGDAVGSLLGIGLALRSSGKSTQMVIADAVPGVFNHLEGFDLIKNKAEPGYDYSIVVDCSDMARTGWAFPDGFIPNLNIDHHPTNLNFARLNFVLPTAVSTTAILASSLAELGLPLTQPVASALLTGLVTDTIGFRTPNINPEALRLAADLMDAGADLPELYQRALVRRTFEAARLWGLALSNLKRANGLVYTSISWAERVSVGYNGKDDADLVNILTSIDGAQIALVMLEQPNQHTKISWRSRPGVDVSNLAVQFGGGGHVNAAGCDIAGSFEDAQNTVIPATLALLQVHETAALVE